MKIFKLTFFFLLIIVFFACKKELSLENINILEPGGTWEFQEGGVQYNGNIDSSFIEGTGTTKNLTIEGKSSGGGENFLITLYATDSFAVGTYNASVSEAAFEYFTSSKTIFEGDFLTGEFAVNITSLSNNTIIGTFSGQVQDSTGSIKQITLGKFESAIDLSNNGSGTGSTTATGTLGSAADTCTPVTLAGTFTQGIALSASNTVEAQVNIITPGTFTITTNNVNGVSFSKNGTFTSTGVQNVILEGSGTPIDAGLLNFTVTFGTSNCTFSINFLPGTPPVTDYFPTTVNSNWSYGFKDDTDPADSFLTTVLPTMYTFGGKDYTAFSEDDIPPSGFPDIFYYRKLDGDYFQYFDLSDYFSDLDGSVAGEYIFLKDNVAEGTTFNSPDFTGTSNGIPVTVYIKVTITAKGVAATVGSQDFNDVIKVTYEYFVNGASAFPPEEKWFAKGVGLIYYDSFFWGEIVHIGSYTVF